MGMDTVPAFGHMDEMEELDSQGIEDWTTIYNITRPQNYPSLSQARSMALSA